MSLLFRLLVVIVLGAPAWAWAQTPAPAWPRRPMMDLPAKTLAFYNNPDGSCVQCSNGMVGAYRNDFNQASLLWDSEYGKAVRGGSSPSRVANYCRQRGISIYNVTGNSVDDTLPWCEWAVKTGRFAAIGCFSSHFQTLYGRDYDRDRWYVQNNWGKWVADEYSPADFRRVHAASGPWIVIPKGPPPAPKPRYVKWWN